MTTRDLFDYTMTGVDFRQSGFIAREWNHHVARALNAWMEQHLKLLELDSDNDMRLQRLKVMSKEVSLEAGVGTLPANFRHPMGIRAGIKKDDTDCGKTFAEQLRPTKRLTEDAHGYRSRDPFSRPSLKVPYYKIAAGKLLIYTGDDEPGIRQGYTMPRASVSYVRHPLPIALEVDEYGEMAGDGSKDTIEPFEEQYLLEIGDLAVRYMLAAVGDPRYQVAAAETQTNSNQS